MTPNRKKWTESKKAQAKDYWNQQQDIIDKSCLELALKIESMIIKEITENLSTNNNKSINYKRFITN
jgi:hypothetical protein